MSEALKAAGYAVGRFGAELMKKAGLEVKRPSNSRKPRTAGISCR